MRPAVGAVALVLVLSGCGSTVQVRGVDVATGGQLGTALPATGTPGGAAAPAQVGGAATTSGARGALPGAPSSTSQGPAQGPVVASAAGTSAGAPLAPLTVGMLITAQSGLSSTGYSLGNTVDERAVDQALVDALNAHGGLLGHKIIPVFASTDTFSSSWEGQYAAACATFTQDHKVQAVLGFSFTYYRSFESCLAQKSVPHLTTSFNIPDTTELAGLPGLVPLDTPTVDRRGLAKVDGAIGTGYLTAHNKLGILTDNCPGTVRSLDDVVLPHLRRAGLPAPRVYTFNCVNSESDGAASGQQLSNAELAFAASGVDRVMMHGVSEGPGIAQFAIMAQSQNYHPGYIVSSLGNLALNNGYVPAQQTRNIHGFGWLPMEDVPVSAYGPMNVNQKRCVSLLRSRGITLSASADYVYAWQICEPFFVYEAALGHDGGRTDLTSLVNGIHALGRSYVSVTNRDGLAWYAAGRVDPVVSERPLLYQDACSCWHYVGPARLIPST